MPSGPPEAFVPKEDISFILDEAVGWIYDFVNREAKQKKVKPYKYLCWKEMFMLFNSNLYNS